MLVKYKNDMEEYTVQYVGIFATRNILRKVLSVALKGCVKNLQGVLLLEYFLKKKEQLKYF